MPSTPPSRGLIVFVKNPQAGKVKTRLARELGETKALEIYLRLLGHTRRVCLGVDADRYLFYSEFIPESDEWPESAFDKHLQASGDLGQRMSDAFDLVLPQSRAALIVGSDCPGLRPALLEQAFRALTTHDYCLGPAADGGYYLLGMKEPSPFLFEDMPWSTAEVASITRQRIVERGRSCHELPVLSDIDYAEDWARHGALLENGEGSGPT